MDASESRPGREVMGLHFDIKRVQPVRGIDKATALKALMVETMGEGLPMLAALFGLLAEARPEDLESHPRMIDYAQRLKGLQYRATPPAERLLERAIDIVMS